MGGLAEHRKMALVKQCKGEKPLDQTLCYYVLTGW